jgi:anaerobic ribonucleoside-triphosphate reductase activating protein
MIGNQTWPETPNLVRLSRRSDRCTVLGPGVRAALWLQGCPLRCPGCVAPETLPFTGGHAIDVARLAEEIAGLQEIQGLTFSGGEPMAQAAALSNLIDTVRVRRDLSAVCYTGFPIGYLRGKGTQAQRDLIDRLDILIDGPYVRRRHTDLRWRGSDNQQVHFLTPRYRHLTHMVQDRGTWIELEMTEQDELHWMGIPPLGFRAAFEQQMRRIGLPMTMTGANHE